MRLTALELEHRLYDLGDGYDHQQAEHGWIMFGLDQRFIIEVEPTVSGVCQFQQSRSPAWTDVFMVTT